MKRIEKYQAKFIELVAHYKLNVNFDLVNDCVSSISLNDDAHNLEHVFAVTHTGLELARRKGLGYLNEKIVFYACLMHDLGCRWDRANHHIISEQKVYEYFDKYPDTDRYHELMPGDIKLIALACLEHRASYDKPRLGDEISRIVALADRGKPDFFLYVLRAYQFRLAEGLSFEKLVEEVYSHFVEKFDREVGYNWKSYPKEGLIEFKEEWEEFHRLATIQNVRNVLQNYVATSKAGKVLNPLNALPKFI